MLKLLRGVINFHQNVLPGMRSHFQQLAGGQKPDALLIACSDSRVAPNVFASTDPGDLFVVRNPGNMIPASGADTAVPGGESEAAAIEIAVGMLGVRDIIVCGHSSCAGMAALLEGSSPPNLKKWIRHGSAAKNRLAAGETLDPSLSFQDQLSQLNVLVQLEHLRYYPQVAERVSARQLRLHGWFFDIAAGNVCAYEPEERKFVLIDHREGARLLARIENGAG